jgi:hypothetical protein
MTDVEETMSVAEAARRLGMTTHDAYTLVLSRRLESVESPSGRRVIPISAVERWRATRPVST